MYPIFSDGNYIKTSNTGSATSWWTSSSSTSAKASANYISNTGTIGAGSATTAYGIPLCFRVG